MKKVCYLSKVCRNEQKCLIAFVENYLDFGKSLMLVVAEKRVSFLPLTSGLKRSVR